MTIESRFVVGEEPMIGEIQIFSGNFAPRGWAFCDGALLSVASHTSLFAVIGTRYGGDGRTSFQLPDLRGRVPVGVGLKQGGSNYELGQRSGAEMVTLSTSQLPGHNHEANVSLNVKVQATSVRGSVSKPAAGAWLGAGYDLETSQNVENYVTQASQSVSIGGGQASVAATVQPTGAGIGHENMMPWQAISYIIALDGIFPSRT